jgi:hypothetical protein
MRLHTIPTVLTLLVAALATLPATAATAAPPSGKDAAVHRVELKGPQGAPLPYTIEVPADWQVRPVTGFPGLWIGPADAKPPEDPRLIWVHGSQVALADPAQIVANIKANDAQHPEWSAPRAEVRDLGGVKGVLWQLDSGTGDKARSVLTLKMPLQATKMFVDFSASAAPADFAKLQPTYEKILLSVRPVAAPPAAGTKQ